MLSISVTPSVSGIGLPWVWSLVTRCGSGGTLAIIQEPNACQASCRLGRSLVDISAEQETARAARQARRGIAQEAYRQ